MEEKPKVESLFGDDEGNINNSQEVIQKEEKIDEVTSKENTPQFDEVQPLYEEVKIEKEIRTDSYFDGKLIEVIGWKILSFLITVISAGLANPWGRCMVISYRVNHTVLNGKRLKFEGNGGNLFVQRFKWLLLTIITLGIYAFWIPIKVKKWELSNIHFEDEPLVVGESYFDGKLIQLIGVNLLCNILNAISFGILYTFTTCFRLKWLAKHSVINRKKIVFDGKGINLFGKYLLWLFLTIITVGIYAFWLGIKMDKWITKNSHIKLANEEYESNKSFILFVLGAIVGGILFIVIVSSIINSVAFGNKETTNDLDNRINEAREEIPNLIDNMLYFYYENYSITELDAFKDLKNVNGWFRCGEQPGDIIMNFNYKAYICTIDGCEKITLDTIDEYIENTKELRAFVNS